MMPAVQRNTSTVKNTGLCIPKTLVIRCYINKSPICALINTESTGNFLSTTIADQLHVKKEELITPLPLQLAVQGSRSKINS